LALLARPRQAKAKPGPNSEFKPGKNQAKAKALPASVWCVSCGVNWTGLASYFLRGKQKSSQEKLDFYTHKNHPWRGFTSRIETFQ